MFVFGYNLVLDSVFYKGTSRIPLMFELIFRLHQVQIRRELILYVIHITGTRMIEAGIDVLSRGNNLVGIIREMIYPQKSPKDQRVEGILFKLYPWIKTW